MKRFVVYSIIVVVLISLLSVAADAEDVVVELSTDDGSSGLVIKNSAGIVVARIDSKGSFIQNAGPVVPPGAVMAFATGNPPTGWLHCNGAAISRTDYADLFAAIGTMYGSGDGSTTFNLPDYRGQFLRSWDNSAGQDPDRANRADRGDGTTGDNVGTRQAGQLASHHHSVSVAAAGGHSHTVAGGSVLSDYGGGGVVRYSGTSSATTSAAGSHGHAVSQSSVGGNETRPRNVSVMWVIKL
ncbi:MAG: phage tail protein [Pseudomonadota bacterium]